MFMTNTIYEIVLLSIYESEFHTNDTLAYDYVMSDLRERINEELKKRGWTVTYLASVSGVPQPTIQRFLKGTHGEPRSKTIKKLAQGFGISEFELRGFKREGTTSKPSEQKSEIVLGQFDLWDDDTPLHEDDIELPFFREVELAAGSGRTEVQENHGLKLRFSKRTLKRQSVQIEHAACVLVSGNSMEPVLPDGCTIGIDTSKKQINNGRMYAIDHDGELRVKMLYKMPGGSVRLRSYNEHEWPDETVPAQDIKILGQVFWYSVLL
jgi:phage repressor protein C with HTH and peptisase S24 domain